MNINMHSMLITPRIDAEYLSALPLILDSSLVDYAMYRYNFKNHVKPFCNILKSFPHIKKILNLPFSDISQILLSLHDFDGVHLKGDKISWIKSLKKQLDSKIIGYSAHKIDEAIKALDMGANYCTLSPIFHSANKGSPLGIKSIESIPLAYRNKILALGGINKDNIQQLQNLGLLGFAGISYFYNKSKINIAIITKILHTKSRTNKHKATFRTSNVNAND